jgi:hypothetical protein
MILNIEHVKRWIIRGPRNVWIDACNFAGDLHNDLLLQQQTKKDLMPDIEIECPSCYDIMALSKLGRLGM